MGLLDWLFGGNDEATGTAVDPAIIEQRIEQVVTMVDPRLKLVPGYHRKLAPAVEQAVLYCRELEAQIPAVIETSAATWSGSPVLRALFATAQDIPAVFSRSTDVQDFFADAPAADETWVDAPFRAPRGREGIRRGGPRRCRAARCASDFRVVRRQGGDVPLCVRARRADRDPPACLQVSGDPGAGGDRVGRYAACGPAGTAQHAEDAPGHSERPARRTRSDAGQRRGNIRQDRRGGTEACRKRAVARKVSWSRRDARLRGRPRAKRPLPWLRTTSKSRR